jgi:hypothetical protein
MTARLLHTLAAINTVTHTAHTNSTGCFTKVPLSLELIKRDGERPFSTCRLSPDPATDNDSRAVDVYPGDARPGP